MSSQQEVTADLSLVGQLLLISLLSLPISTPTYLSSSQISSSVASLSDFSSFPIPLPIYLLYPGIQAQNFLKRVEGLDNLKNLTTLHLRDNQIDSLTGFSEELKALQYLNLRYAPTSRPHLVPSPHQEQLLTVFFPVPIPQSQPIFRFSPHPPS